MTSKADFTDEEWTRLKRAPFVAGMAISFADPGGPIEAFKETAATLRTALADAGGGTHGELVRELAVEVQADAKARHNPLSGFKPEHGSTATAEILGELTEANRIVAAKATPEEAAGFRAWLLDAAKAAADAAKEGGFLGFHAERVSQGERDMLERLDQALTTPAA